LALMMSALLFYSILFHNIAKSAKRITLLRRNCNLQFRRIYFDFASMRKFPWTWSCNWHNFKIRNFALKFLNLCFYIFMICCSTRKIEIILLIFNILQLNFYKRKYFIYYFDFIVFYLFYLIILLHTCN